MKKTTTLILLLALALLVVGCTSSYAQPTGNAGYPQQQNPYQGYYGGGCGVSGVDSSMPIDVSEQSSIVL